MYFRFLLNFSMKCEKIPAEIEGLTVMKKDKIGTPLGANYYLFTVTKKAEGNSIENFLVCS